MPGRGRGRLYMASWPVTLLFKPSTGLLNYIASMFEAYQTLQTEFAVDMTCQSVSPRLYLAVLTGADRAVRQCSRGCPEGFAW
jgi:hypothetical protein